MKRFGILVVAVAAIGVGIGGLAVSRVLAASNAASSHTDAISNTNSTWDKGSFASAMGSGLGPMSQANEPGNFSMGNGYGMMGNGAGSNGWAGAMGSMMSQFFGPGKTINSAQADQDMQSSLRNATVDKSNNSITYDGQTVNIVVFGGAMDDGSSGPAEKFVVGGLVNPTLHVSKDAKVTFELINEDTDMPHGIEVTSAQPPYAYMSMMQGGIYPGTFIHPIPAANQNSLPMSTTTFTASESGTFNYICQYPGHASEGMFGRIVVG